MYTVYNYQKERKVCVSLCLRAVQSALNLIPLIPLFSLFALHPSKSKLLE